MHMYRKHQNHACAKRAFLLTMCCLALLSAACSDQKQNAESGSAESNLQTDQAAETEQEPEHPFTAEGMRFSQKSGFYDNGFSLSISAEDGGDIYYTLDGSIPTAESLHYDAPIVIKDRSDEENRLCMHTDIAQPLDSAADFVPDAKVDKATIVRAVRIDQNGQQSGVVTNSYFVGFADKANFYQDVKIVSLITDEENLFDREKGIYVTGKIYDDWKNSADYDPETPEWSLPGNYTQKGRDWEREAAIQFFADGQLAAEQNVGIRIHGGATRSYSQKSINVYARTEYGAPKLKYDLFSGQVKTQYDDTPLQEFDSFTLRNGGNDAYYTRFSDKLIQSSVADRQFLTQGMEPCIVFINGEFWGHYEITEKMDQDFIAAHYNIPAKEICIVKAEKLDEGTEETFAEWEQLWQWIKDTDFAEQSAYDELCERVDMQGFMDYVSTEIYINNADWGRPNSAMWKAEQPASDAPCADGKWRFILYDTEYSSGLYGEAVANTDSFAELLDQDCFLSDLFRGALENETFRKQFADTFMEIADHNFAPARMTAEIDRLSKAYQEMTIATYDRFWSGWMGGSAAQGSYGMAVSSLRNFYSKRYDRITEYLKAYIEAPDA
ncbi:MAG TPA: hypothetical protein DCG49_04350 [Ruminococcus sp.]|nr:hypothetical protein [Ruminococcus sp.]